MSTTSKSYLVISYNGSRGDFLISILLGDVLLTDYQQHQIKWVGDSDPHTYMRLHGLGQPMFGTGGTGRYNQHPPKPFEDFDYIIRIKLANLQEMQDAVMLARFKLQDRGFNPDLDQAMRYETDFAAMDHCFDQVVTFGDLWDLDKIKNLFLLQRKRPMSAQEEDRVKHNISINLQLLDQMRLTSP